MQPDFLEMLLRQKNVLQSQQREIMAQHRLIMTQQREIMAQQREIEAELLRVNALIEEQGSGSSTTRLKILPKPARVRGVLAAARRAIEQFSEPFDKKQLLEKMRELDQELAHKRITDSNIRHTLRLLTQGGEIKLESAATPRSRATYVRAA